MLMVGLSLLNVDHGIEWKDNQEKEKTGLSSGMSTRIL